MFLDWFQWVLHLAEEHGYVGIFVPLALGILALPLPDEAILMFAGYLVYRADLRLFPTLMIAFAGSSCGITMSYGLGRSACCWSRLRRLARLSPERLDAARRWFERRGKWSLTFGFYLPGIRHLIAFVAGSSGLATRSFTLYAWTGALLWSWSYIILGLALGEQWAAWVGHIHVSLLIASATIIILAVLYWFWRTGRSR